jgi:hypothetical protein
MFQAVFNSAVESFDHPVTTTVVSRGKYFRNTVELTNFCLKLIKKLRAFIEYEIIWYAVSGEIYPFETRIIVVAFLSGTGIASGQRAKESIKTTAY